MPLLDEVFIVCTVAHPIPNKTILKISSLQCLASHKLNTANLLNNKVLNLSSSLSPVRHGLQSPSRLTLTFT